MSVVYGPRFVLSRARILQEVLNAAARPGSHSLMQHNVFIRYVSLL